MAGGRTRAPPALPLLIAQLVLEAALFVAGIGHLATGAALGLTCTGLYAPLLSGGLTWLLWQRPSDGIRLAAVAAAAGLLGLNVVTVGALSLALGDLHGRPYRSCRWDRESSKPVDVPSQGCHPWALTRPGGAGVRGHRLCAQRGSSLRRHRLPPLRPRHRRRRGRHLQTTLDPPSPALPTLRAPTPSPAPAPASSHPATAGSGNSRLKSDISEDGPSPAMEEIEKEQGRLTPSWRGIRGLGRGSP